MKKILVLLTFVFGFHAQAETCASVQVEESTPGVLVYDGFDMQKKVEEAILTSFDALAGASIHNCLEAVPVSYHCTKTLLAEAYCIASSVTSEGDNISAVYIVERENNHKVRLVEANYKAAE